VVNCSSAATPGDRICRQLARALTVMLAKIRRTAPSRIFYWRVLRAGVFIDVQYNPDPPIIR